MSLHDTARSVGPVGMGRDQRGVLICDRDAGVCIVHMRHVLTTMHDPWTGAHETRVRMHV
jgi:phosphoribosyl-dephospho-CoA transferase